ncbi:aldehyde dehydrogenase family protein [Actinomycetospora endophytica]|uniref:Aldehyde dehydrogenase family protein n=1 Tax=Actinomycetospora endophytica TaxID=2291215 RepID=A0ABS8P3M4_9PSEU|nr:aldehyde dehydrogenase family protein [Actinomycetospora endophytica]MCD2192850.1 aldehyde dehydrogenase family protein [Actinomycetospora endophytica]
MTTTATPAGPRTATIPEVGHLIDGLQVFRDLRDVHDPGRLDEVVARVAAGGSEDVERAVTAAHRAFPGWRDTPVPERIRRLTAAAETLGASGEELAPLLVREHGGLLHEAESDFGVGTGVLRHTLSVVEDVLGVVAYDDERGSITIEKVPRGVAVAIVPWNMPITLAMLKLAPALATGNTLVVKPSPSAPAALTLALSRMVDHLPSGVLGVVHGGADVGDALCRHPLVRKVSFTGGTTAGRRIIESAAPGITDLTLELGGNDPALVLDDADPDLTVDRMVPGVFMRSGQVCFAVKRVYVPRRMYARFADAFCDRVDQYAVGHGLNPASSFGPLGNEAQHRRVTDLLRRTAASSARVIERGSKVDESGWDNGYYVLPHVVLDADHDAPISREEQFGPLVPLIAYDDEEQALAWVNDSEHGLASSVWCADPERGLAMARRVEAGSTFVNTHSFESLDPRMPFGGIKCSGIGRECGDAGMAGYVEAHAIRHLQ